MRGDRERQTRAEDPGRAERATPPTALEQPTASHRSPAAHDADQPAISSIAAAIVRSLSVTVFPASCVVSEIETRLYTFDQSGWWLSSSEWRLRANRLFEITT